MRSDAAMSGQPLVQVLLATYNGARYLREQMESVLAQDDPAVEILARDDGSSDGTVEILEEYARRLPERVRLVSDGVKSGSAKENFLQLLAASSAPYVCLCDQDDVWLPGKVSASLQAMRGLEAKHGKAVPLLVFSDLRVVDAELRELSPSYWRQERVDPSAIARLRSTLGQNVVTGCTAMLNRPLVELALRMPEETPMHDRWIALLATTLGHSAFLTEATVLYRQHGGNVVGARVEAETLEDVARRTRNSGERVKQWWVNQDVAAALLRLHGEALQMKDRRLVEAYLRCGASPSPWVRVGTLLRHRIFRTGLLRNVATVWELWRLKPRDPQ
jgi:glycosyltransferase involved in cell wall biosynthesis